MKLPPSYSSSPVDAKLNEARLEVLRQTIECISKDSFFLCDQALIETKAENLQQAYPTIKPYFDMYDNSHSVVLSTLYSRGFGFLCRNKFDLRLVLDLGIDPKHVFFCPTKAGLIRSHLKLAAAHKVGLVGFHSESDLSKIASVFPDAKLMLCTSLCNFDESSLIGMIKLVADLDLDLIGVSVASQNDLEFEPNVAEQSDFLERQMTVARIVCRLAEHIALKTMTIIDVGQIGFENAKANFNCMEKHSEKCGTSLIGRVGLELTEAAFTFAAKIVEKKHHHDPFFVTPCYSYVLNENFHNMFGHRQILSQDVSDFEVSTLRNMGDSSAAAILDSSEKVICSPEDGVYLPSSLEVGDWILFDKTASVTPLTPEQFSSVQATHDKFWILTKSCGMDEEIEDVFDPSSFDFSPEL